MTKTNENIDYGAALDKLKQNPFNPDYRPDQIAELSGYQRCMNQLLQYLTVVTEFKPEKRMIDALPLLEGIKKGNEKVTAILTEGNDLPDGLFQSPGTK